MVAHFPVALFDRRRNYDSNFFKVERPPVQPITGERPVIPPNNGATLENARFRRNQVWAV